MNKKQTKSKAETNIRVFMLDKFLSCSDCRLLERRAAVPYPRKRLNSPLVHGIGTRRQLHLCHTAVRYGFLSGLRSNSLWRIETVHRFQSLPVSTYEVSKRLPAL